MVETVHVRGLRELERNLREISDLLGERASGRIYTNALKKAGWVIAREAKRRAPVLAEPTPYRVAGAIKQGITAYPVRWNVIHVRVRNRGNPHRARKEKRRPNRGADSPRNPYYWWYVEFGTSKMSKRPFMRPAFEAKKYEAIEVVKEELARGIAKAILSLNVGRRA